MDKWIFTSEKLPPIGEWVLVTNGKCDGKHCEIMTYHGLKTQRVHRVGGGEYEEQYHEWTSGHGDILSENPLAWMPLPKPYEPQESEEV